MDEVGGIYYNSPEMYDTLEKLANALNYPAEIPAGARDFVFFVDGHEVVASERADGVVLKFVLACSDELLPDLAGYAAGRLLREDAVLACENGTLFLWRALPRSADAGTLRREFELFVDSCEWWLARCAEKEVPRSVLPDIMIRP